MLADSDFTNALQLLRQRCEASGYRRDDIEYVFSSYENLPRNLYGQPNIDRDDHHEVRLVALAGTPYAADIDLFAKRMNRVLSSSKIRVSIIRTTGPSIAKLLFHNNDSVITQVDCRSCIVCNNQARNSDSSIWSTTTGKTYQTARNISCRNGGIYIFEGTVLISTRAKLRLSSELWSMSNGKNHLLCINTEIIANNVGPLVNSTLLLSRTIGTGANILCPNENTSGIFALRG